MNTNSDRRRPTIELHGGAIEFWTAGKRLSAPCIESCGHGHASYADADACPGGLDYEHILHVIPKPATSGDAPPNQPVKRLRG